MAMPHQHNPMEKPMNGNGAAPAYPTGFPAGAPGKWSFGMFDCFSPFGTCKSPLLDDMKKRSRLCSLNVKTTGCLGCWCPCLLYGRTQDRYKGDQDSSGCNGSVSSLLLLMSSSLYTSVICQRKQPMSSSSPARLTHHCSPPFRNMTMIAC